jgi:hypothetical protein
MLAAHIAAVSVAAAVLLLEQLLQLLLVDGFNRAAGGGIQQSQAQVRAVQQGIDQVTHGGFLYFLNENYTHLEKLFKYYSIGFFRLRRPDRHKSSTHSQICSVSRADYVQAIKFASV